MKMLETDVNEVERRFFYKDGIPYDITLTDDGVIELFREKMAKGFYECEDYSQKVSRRVEKNIGAFMVKSSKYDYRFIRIFIFRCPDPSDSGAHPRIEICLDAVDDPMAYIQLVSHYRGSGIPKPGEGELVWIFGAGFLANMYVRSLSTMVDDFNAMDYGCPYWHTGVRSECIDEITHGNITRRILEDEKNLFDLVNRR